jgi:hypothetical protein
VFEPSAAGKLLGRSALPQHAVPTRPRNTRPPSLSPEQKAASLRTVPPTVIIQEDTPAALEQRPSSGPSSAVFLWAKEWSAVKRVAVAATAAGLLAGVLIVAFGRSAPATDPGSSDGELARAVPAARSEPPAPAATVEPVAAAPEPTAEQNRQLEVPEASPEGSARAKSAEPAPTAGRGAAKAPKRVRPAKEPIPEPEKVSLNEPMPAAEPEPVPAPARDEEEELLVNPYSRSPSAEAPAPVPDEAQKKAPAPAKAATSKASRDCKQPYYLDADGIRRVKPECL